jgi:hypothetical protein
MLDGSKIINGTHAHTWLDDEDVAEATALQAKIDITKEDVVILGQLAKGHKMTGWEGKGTLKANHVTSRFIVKQSTNLKNGISTICTIVSKLADPAAYGAERIALKGVMFDDMTLTDWEGAKTGTIDVGFTFEDFELLDVIDPSLIS